MTEFLIQLDMVALTSASVMAVACAFAALHHRWRFRQGPGEQTEACVGRLARTARLSGKPDSKAIESARKEAQRLSHQEAAAAVVAHQLAHPQADPAGAIDHCLLRIDGGLKRWLGYLTHLPILLGLLGTLLGLKEALANFSGETNDPHVFVSGFVTAIQTTVYGVLIAIGARTISKVLWEPLLSRVSEELWSLSMQLQAVLASPSPRNHPQRLVRARPLPIKTSHRSQPDGSGGNGKPHTDDDDLYIMGVA